MNFKWPEFHWPSERTLFGVMIIVGFYTLATLAVLAKLEPDARQTAKDALLVVGPLLGVIVQSIFKTDKAEAQRADTAAILAAKAPDQSAMVSVPVTPPATVTVEETTDAPKQ